ncbi:hypothetical protein LSTR_LSTR004078 [Laodelphax striatellus]|uniref:Transmembrane protein 223 n=1 Tax=Laodelphax striatellus TaxID=195883 RepID=A0A482WH44_LAOST|nr:hypothetical protein LSTR_LSTR004078 [Laodelphax striatellus]
MNAILGNSVCKSSLILKNFVCVHSARFYVHSASSSSILRVDTNVTKDVVLFTFDKVRQVRMLNIFGFGQCIFWNYWAYLLYTSIKDTPVDESKLDENSKWYDKINLGENKYKISFAATCGFIGNAMCFAALMYTRRCVNKVVLRRGGKTVLFKVYTFWGGTRTFSTPLANVSCAFPRDLSKWSTPLKVKGHSLFYTLDNVGGKYYNVTLFDATVGLKRSLK